MLDRTGDTAVPAATEDTASPFRTTSEPPPKFSWVHAWGMTKWGKKAGRWGEGTDGLSKESSRRSD